MKNQASGIHIGTSGWNYKHWKGAFYPKDLRPKHWFGYYAVEKFMENVRGLGEKLGPVLFQLPPRWKCNPGRLESLNALRLQQMLEIL